MLTNLITYCGIMALMVGCLWPWVVSRGAGLEWTERKAIACAACNMLGGGSIISSACCMMI